MRISLFHEEDVRHAARRVVELSREQMERVVGHTDERAGSGGDNPYVRVFVELFRYANGQSTDDHQAATCLEVADSVLGNPLYAGAQGATEGPLLRFVFMAAVARQKLRSGKALNADERALLE